MGETLVIGIVNGAVYGLIALGIVLVYKGSRVLNFGQGELGTFGLFVTWWLVVKQGMPWGVGALAGVAAAVAVALAFERLVVRRMGDAPRLSVAVATVGLFLFLLAAEAVVWREPQVVLRPPFSGLGPKILGYFVSPTQILALVAVAGIGLALAAFLRATDFGLGVLAAAQDPTMVRLVGVPLSRVSAFTWGLAGALGAMAAILIGPIFGAFAPGFMTRIFIWGLAAALLGGLTSLPGAFVGGIAVGIFDSAVQRVFLTGSVPGVPSIALLLVILAVLLFRPSGLLGKVATR
ncbi:MAG TPA: branched-chain amino acid ABC transporter permease [Actinomycetota bacterium]|nr:branched-chain amino acid ABC transporter permease [Actinomycetota bacterium]